MNQININSLRHSDMHKNMHKKYAQKICTNKSAKCGIINPRPDR